MEGILKKIKFNPLLQAGAPHPSPSSSSQRSEEIQQNIFQMWLKRVTRKRINHPARIDLIPFPFSLPDVVSSDVTPHSPHRMRSEDSLHPGEWKTALEHIPLAASLQYHQGPLYSQGNFSSQEISATHTSYFPLDSILGKNMSARQKGQEKAGTKFLLGK